MARLRSRHLSLEPQALAIRVEALVLSSSRQRSLMERDFGLKMLARTAPRVRTVHRAHKAEKGRKELRETGILGTAASGVATAGQGDKVVMAVMAAPGETEEAAGRLFSM